MFVDEVKVYARAGHGGKGCVAFHREAFIPKGGPSGGNGGRGGSVILQADRDVNDLTPQFYCPRLIADNGGHGLGKGMDGKAGKDIIIKVPCGTLIWLVANTQPDPEPVESVDDTDDEDDSSPEMIPTSASTRPKIRHQGSNRAIEYDLESIEEEPEQAPTVDGPRELVADMTEHGQQFILCKGGRGGLGNRNFATSRRQAPRYAQPGEPGTEGQYLFELRIMAEIGLVGYPNAGKSTLLGAISKARPKVAPYPFTTLHPQIGIVEYDDYVRLTVCDVPGLIAGAHENKGLGLAFLRHIKRCRILVILLDMAGTDGRKPWDDYKQVLEELKYYDPELLERPRLVAANKMDEEASAELLKQFKRKVRKTTILPLSAAFDIGVKEFKDAIRAAYCLVNK